jgi:hypothetical protein
VNSANVSRDGLNAVAEERQRLVAEGVDYQSIERLQALGRYNPHGICVAAHVEL